MSFIRKMSLKWGSLIAALALLIATGTVGATCYFTAYQPKMPEQLKK